MRDFLRVLFWCGILSAGAAGVSLTLCASGVRECDALWWWALGGGLGAAALGFPFVGFGGLRTALAALGSGWAATAGDGDDDGGGDVDGGE